MRTDISKIHDNSKWTAAAFLVFLILLFSF